MAISRRAIFTLALSVLSMLPFAAEAQQTAKKAASSSTGSNQKPIRIAVMQFSHETVTFLPYETTTNDFIYEGSPARGEALLESSPNGYIGGFVKVAREHANVELVGIESPLGSKKGSGSGWITKEAFDHFVDNMIKDLKAQGPFDGAYLSLHGAMGVKDVAKPEAVIARRVREAIGPKAYIVGTFDPHGNEDDEFLKYANLAFTIKYYPHYDGSLQGERAARTLIRSIRGDYKPTTATRKPPIITASVLQWTGASPWMDLVQRALVWEARSPDVYVNFYYGFAFADVVDAGMTFQVMTNGDPELANKIADDMANTAWRLREQLVSGTKVYSMTEGVKLAKEAIAKGKTPFVLADHSDRSGAATWLLKQVIDQKLSKTLIGTVADNDVIEELRKKGVKVGDKFDMMVGGKLDESAGDPVRVVGTVNTVSGGLGRRGSAASSQLWVSVKFGDGNVLIISPYLHQNTDPEDFMNLGINIKDFKGFAIKSRVHFRRGYDDNGFAPTILLVEPDQPFLGTVRLEGLKYQHLKLNTFYPYNKSIVYPAKK
ncbi:MAG: M81 family metallopeptidase [Hydrocarboniphaga sp.]|jgi:microcystin degradation protein MlrC|uniref:MlrC superfamily protein n=1 Tax=Hydrocarboniphaga effusa AP103 TaxID=1172194 RepID=I8T4T3_9GAMM|nr:MULTISPECIES: M81 family metallopeptidase [Hydrocarboniphaga]EIT68743.1 MlrC superfamily protein [Hydrocarboniphaga effusa AP103]MDZ4076913.1 M81 family metallopeptidase [Hydrocarboniphaga sp.]